MSQRVLGTSEYLHVRAHTHVTVCPRHSRIPACQSTYACHSVLGTREYLHVRAHMHVTVCPGHSRIPACQSTYACHSVLDTREYLHVRARTHVSVLNTREYLHVRARTHVTACPGHSRIPACQSTCACHSVSWALVNTCNLHVRACVSHHACMSLDIRHSMHACHSRSTHTSHHACQSVISNF